MDEEELRQIQDDEKVAIQAIFDEDAEFEVNVWKVWKPLAVTIHLEPVESASFSTTRKNFVSLDLIVQCCSSYPKVAPTLSCGVVKGISNEDVRILFQKLSTKCEELIGSAMILELCEMVRLFLYEKNTPLAGSFHDTMLKKKASEESEMRRQRAHSEKRELEQVVEERDRHIIEAQWKKETEKENLNHAVAKNTDIRMIAGHRITVIDDVTLKRPRIHSLCTEWMGSCNNDDILVSEWTFQYTLGRHHHHKKTPNFDSFLKKCDEMEAQLTRVTSLVELDQTVVPICFATLQREHISPTNMLIKVMIGQKVSQREESLASATAIDTLKQDASLIRRLAAHMVCALRWLHDQQFSHGSVTSSAIWMTDNSFRISDIGILPLLRSLADCFQQSISGREMDILTEPMERSPRRKDLFALGTLLDQLKTSISPSNSSSTLSSSCELTEFILCCQSAKTTDDLLNHSYLVLDLLPSGSDVGRLGVRTEADSRGRLVNEFLVMKWLGKGGFGDVILAKNKLDGNDYAVKRIPLNPKSEKLNRRITREAKLFSKLNHPNVVRYYSAWIEDASRQKERPSVEKGDAKKDKISPKRISLDDGADSLLPTRLRNLELAVTRGERGDTSEWSTSYRKGVKQDTVDSSSDDDSGDLVRTLFSPRNNASEDDFEILFEASGSAAPESDPVTETEATGETSAATTSAGGTTAPTATTAVTENTNECSIPSRLLYIQMEYCERSTLRVLIDSRSLVGNAKTIWRIFGEILAGLLYIHRLGMIHRDIKPMNILLDSQDRVKIGDFGLATRDLLLKKDYLSTSHDGKMSGQTRDIGTELYMAPELFVLDDTHPYTSKIDVYSTGIILFEMFYRPLPPGMERISTIKNLKKAINMPDDFGIEFSAVQTSLARRLIEWMLSEKADERPTVEQLLAEDRIPIADIDDENFQGIFLRTIKKRSGRLFHWMIDAVFKEEASAALNYCFDQQICMDKFNASRDHELEAIRGEISAVCRLHSFEPLDTHLLTPAKQPTGSRNKPVTLMDTAGYIGALPVDLRQNFVRYCCRNAVYRLKRYTFSKVFSNNDSVGGVHPCERHECSVDSIGPVSAALTLTADLLTTVGQLANTTLDGLKCTLRIGHVHVIESAMRHLAIPVETRMLVLQSLHQISTSPKVLSTSDKMDALSEIVGERLASSLLSFLPSELSISLLKESCKTLTRSRDEHVRDSVRNALNDIGKVVEVLTAESSFGVDIVLDTSLVYRPATFSDGIIFILSVEVQQKTRKRSVVVLAGGRYDSSLSRERHPNDLLPSSPLCLVGCSISMEILAHIRKCVSGDSSSIPCSAVVCSYSMDLLLEKFRLARQLWNRGIATDILHEPVDSLDSLVEHCDSRGIENILVVFGTNEVLLRSNDVDHGKLDFDTAVAVMSMSLDSDDEENVTIVTTPLSATRSGATCQNNLQHTATVSNCNITFALPDKVPFSAKKRIENQVGAVLTDVVTLFSSKIRIEVVVTELSIDLLKTIAGSMNRNIEQDQLTLLFDGLSRHHGKAKECLESLFQCLSHICSPRQMVVPVIVLYRHQDGFYRIVA